MAAVKVSTQYRGAIKGFGRYWRSYGGLRAVLASPFFHVSVLILAVCGPLWWSGPWWTSALSIVPSLLGFSIASFTILLSVGDEKFRRLLGVVRPGKTESTLVRSASAFFHFILLQAIVLVVALVASSRPLGSLLAASGYSFSELPGPIAVLALMMGKTFRAVGMLLLIYTLMSAVAAMLNVFRITQLFSDFASQQNRRDTGAQKPPPEA